MKKLYVGNLPYNVSERDVMQLFATQGQVLSVKLFTDRATGKTRGFAYVDMDSNGAVAAIAALDGYYFGGRRLRVSEANRRGLRRFWQ